jgi:hypothetical protein
MSTVEALARFERLQQILVSFVGAREEFDESEYRTLRSELIADPSTRGLLPKFVIQCRNEEQLLSFFNTRKDGLGSSWEIEPARKLVWQQFGPILEQLEMGETGGSPMDLEYSETEGQTIRAKGRPSQEFPLAPETVEKGTPVIFIGHGGSLLWRSLKDFVAERLGLDWDEFNRESVAGISTAERLQRMLDKASFAFLIMTGEDEVVGGKMRARENVVHEIGLFQGRLGLRRAIILLEEGCGEFSNISGLSYILFPKGRIDACFEDVRRVLEREGVLP